MRKGEESVKTDTLLLLSHCFLFSPNYCNRLSGLFILIFRCFQYVRYLSLKDRIPVDELKYMFQRSLWTQENIAIDLD